MVAVYCRQQRLPKITHLVEIYITYYEKDKRRDVDNVYSSSKYILDGMVNAGVLPRDSQKWVRDVKSSIEYDKANPRVRVLIEPAIDKKETG